MPAVVRGRAIPRPPRRSGRCAGPRAGGACGGRVGVIGSLRKALDEVAAGGDLFACPNPDLLAQPGAYQGVVNGHQSLAERQADIVGELQRRRARAALCTVDHDEVRRGVLVQHGLAHAEELAARTDAQLEPDRLAVRELAHPGQEAHQLARCRVHAVEGRRDHGPPLGHAADLRDLRGDLGTRQHAADAGLGPLTDLQRHAFDLVVRRLLGERPLVEAAVLRPAPEVPGSYLPDEVTAGAQVVLRQAALAGVVGEPAHPGAGVEGRERPGGQRTEAHRRHVEQGHVVRPRAVRSADPDAGRVRAHRSRGHRRGEVLAPGPVHVEFGAERFFRVRALGALVDDAARIAVEGPAVEVPLDEVLLELRSQCFQCEAEVPQQGVVPQDGVPSLHQVVDGR